MLPTVLPKVPKRRPGTQAGTQRGQRRLHAEEQRQQTAEHPHQPVHPAAAATHQTPWNQRVHMGSKKETDRLHRTLLFRADGHLLDLLQRARYPARQTVRQRAECPVAARAVPATNPHPRGLYTIIGAVTAQAASRPQAQKARRGACLPPALPDNILLSGQSRFMSELNGPSTAHGPATVIARATFFALSPHLMPGQSKQSHPQAEDVTSSDSSAGNGYPKRAARIQAAGKKTSCFISASAPSRVGGIRDKSPQG